MVIYIYMCICIFICASIAMHVVIAPIDCVLYIVVCLSPSISLSMCIPLKTSSHFLHSRRMGIVPSSVALEIYIVFKPRTWQDHTMHCLPRCSSAINALQTSSWHLLPGPRVACFGMENTFWHATCVPWMHEVGPVWTGMGKRMLCCRTSAAENSHRRCR